jgi:hypothetical protein
MYSLFEWVETTLLILALYFLSKYIRERVASDKTGKSRDLLKLKELSHNEHQHEIIEVYSNLVEKDGAGFWPPRAKHHSWPKALGPYHDIYLELAPRLSTEKPSLSDVYNNERRNDFRSRMQKLLKERIDVTEVQKLLTEVEAGNWDLIDRDAYNGFFSCIAISRHAYRYVLFACSPRKSLTVAPKMGNYPGSEGSTTGEAHRLPCRALNAVALLAAKFWCDGRKRKSDIECYT